MGNATHGGKGDRNRSSNATFRSGWDAIFGKNKEEEMLLTIPLFDEEPEEKPLTQVQIDRKLKEWGMMYDCLQNIHLYDYPVQEARELLKQIKIS